MQVLEHNSRPVCIMCGGLNTRRLKYCTQTHPDNPPYINISSNGTPPAPHLHVTCERCGYEWLERTLTQEKDFDRMVADVANQMMIGTELEREFYRGWHECLKWVRT